MSNCALFLVKCALFFSRLPLSIIFSTEMLRQAQRNTDDSSTVRSSFPFKDQVAANAVQKRLHYCCNHLLKENQFRVLRKYRGKFDCLVFEMLFIKNLKPNFNIQTASIRANLFV